MSHPTHKTRMSDSTLYDEVCTVCGKTDQDNGLAGPCFKEFIPAGKNPPAPIPLTADGFQVDCDGLARPLFLLLDGDDGLPTVHRYFAAPFYDQKWQIRLNDVQNMDLSRCYATRARAFRQAIVDMNRKVEEVISKINEYSAIAEREENCPTH